MRYVACTLLVVACGGASPEPERPVYIPTNSPEAEPLCKKQWTEAKAAREALLDDASTQARRHAAESVFEHAECEHTEFVRKPVDAVTEPELIVALRATREQYQVAKNLYEEVVRYAHADFMHAHVRLGDLHLAYGKKLRNTSPPADVRAPAARRAYAAELVELSRTFDADAAAAYAKALDAAGTMKSLVPKSTLEWVPQTCQKLAALDGARRSARERICAAF